MEKEASQQRLNQLVANADNYECRDKDRNHEKRVIALLGPSAVGKSTIIRECLERAKDHDITSIDEVGTSTTRPRRSSDPDNYHTDIPHEEMIEMIEQGKLINWSSHPSGHIYGTLPRDFTSKYNLMACLPDSVPMLKRAGFAVIHSAYIVTTAERWEDQLETRMYTPETLHLPENQRQYRPDFSDRMEEAIASLHTIIRRYSTDYQYIINEPTEKGLAWSADQILKTSKLDKVGYSSAETHPRFNQYARDMWSRAIDLAWESKPSQQ